MFLGIKAEVTNFSLDDSKKGCKFTLAFDDNPLIDFLQLPEKLSELQYSNIICGAITGALSLVLYFLFKK